METQIRRIISTFLIAVMLLGMFPLTFDAYAEDLEPRKPVVFFVTYDENGGFLRYQNSGNMLYSGDRCDFTPYMSDHRIIIFTDNLTDITYTSLDPDIVEVTQYIDEYDGNVCKAEVKCKSAGQGTIQIDIPADDRFGARTVYCDLNVIKTSLLSRKFYKRVSIDGISEETVGKHYLQPGETDNDSVAFDISDQGAGIRLDADNVSYSSSDEKVLKIDSATGDITLMGAGTAKVTASVPESDKYKAGLYHCVVTVTDPNQQQNTTTEGNTGGTQGGTSGSSTATSGTAATASATAAKTTAAVTVPKLTKPKLKCTKRMKKANKLTWTKVTKATGYQLYIKYPGKKKYVKALTKSAKVKSVTHRGLKRKKYYYYKLRAYVKVGGKYYYGPFSKAIKVKVK